MSLNRKNLLMFVLSISYMLGTSLIGMETAPPPSITGTIPLIPTTPAVVGDQKKHSTDAPPNNPLIQAQLHNQEATIINPGLNPAVGLALNLATIKGASTGNTQPIETDKPRELQPQELTIKEELQEVSPIKVIGKEEPAPQTQEEPLWPQPPPPQPKAEPPANMSPQLQTPGPVTETALQSPDAVPLANPSVPDLAPQSSKPALDETPKEATTEKTILKFDEIELGSSIVLATALIINQYLTCKNGANSKSAIISDIITEIIRLASDYSAFSNSTKTVVDYGTLSLMIASLINIFFKIAEIRNEIKTHQEILDYENLDDENVDADITPKIESTYTTKLDKLIPFTAITLTVARAGVKIWDCQLTSKYISSAISLLRSRELYTKANEHTTIKILAKMFAIIAVASAGIDLADPGLNKTKKFLDTKIQKYFNNESQH